MAINSSYYNGKAAQLGAYLQLIHLMGPVLTPLVQYAEDHLPNINGSDKLKAVVHAVKNVVSDDPETTDLINKDINAFTGAVSAFASIQKVAADIKAAAPAGT